MFWLFVDRVSIVESPANNITVNESEIATFTCTVTGGDNFNIEWDVGGVLYGNKTCMESPKCESIDNSESNDGGLTSTLIVTGMTSLDITCVINQTLTVPSEESGVEIRLPHTQSIRTSTVYFGKP